MYAPVSRGSNLQSYTELWTCYPIIHMSLNRQQRVGRDRRAVTAASPQRSPQIANLYAASTAHTVSIGLRQIAQPPIVAITAGVGQGSGIPSILRTFDSTLPTGAALSVDGQTLTLTYAAPDIAAGEVFLVGPYDPAIRDAYGGFLAPGLIIVPAMSPLPADAVYTAHAASLTTIEVTIAAGLPVAFEPMALNNHDGFTDQLPTSYSYDGAVYTLVYVGPVNVHDTITYTGAALTGDGLTWRNLSRDGVDVS